MLAAGAVAASGLLSRPARAADRLRLRLDYTTSGLHAPFYLGLERGWFTKWGVDLYMEDGNGSSMTVQLVATDAFDVGFCSLAPLVVARAKGLPLQSVACFERKGDLGLMVPQESGWKEPKDLIGKKIVYSAASQEGAIVRPFFKANGVSEDQIQLLNVDGPSRYTVYFTKEADSILTTAPGFLPIAKTNRPSTPILLADFGFNLPGVGLVAHDSTIKDKADALRRFVSVTCGAWTYIFNGHEKEAIRAIIAQRPNGVFNEAMLGDQIALYRPYFYSFGTQDWPIGVQSVPDWEATIKSLEMAKVIPNGTKPADYLTNDFIDQSIVRQINS